MAGWGDEDKSEGGDISKFNPAQHKMNRINELSRIINETKLSPASWNVEFNDWNYNVYFIAVTRLYREVSTKFSEDEKKECDKFRNKIEECLVKYPVRQMMRRNKWGSLNSEYLRIFLKYMEKYEEKVREYQDEHGLDTPNQEDDEGL